MAFGLDFESNVVESPKNGILAFYKYGKLRYQCKFDL